MPTVARTRPAMRPRPRLLVTLAALALAAAACGGGSGQATTSGDDGGERAPAEAASATDDAAPITVVATTSILGDVVGQLVGDDGEVTVLMGPGVDPHAYAPSARDAALLREADLVVANGLGLEESLVGPLEAAAEEGARVFELAPQVDPVAYDERGHDDHAHDDDDHAHDDEGDDHAHDEEGHEGHDHGPEDAHVWFDPERMARGVELLAAELAEVAPHVEADEWETRGAAYADEVLAVDAELADAFAAVPDDRRVIVTNHDALGYLADRYDLDVVGTVVPGSSTQAEADPRGFTELIATVEDLGIDTVFADNTDSTRLAEQLASEVIGRGDLEVEVVQVATDALGEPGTPSETYVGLLRETGTTVAAALAG